MKGGGVARCEGGGASPPEARGTLDFIQDMRSLQSFLALDNHPGIAPLHLHCPRDCNAIARLLRNTVHETPSPPSFIICMSYTIQYWLSQYRVKAKGHPTRQARHGPNSPRHEARCVRHVPHTSLQFRSFRPIILI